MVVYHEFLSAPDQAAPSAHRFILHFTSQPHKDQHRLWTKSRTLTLPLWHTVYLRTEPPEQAHYWRSVELLNTDWMTGGLIVHLQDKSFKNSSVSGASLWRRRCAVVLQGRGSCFDPHLAPIFPSDITAVNDKYTEPKELGQHRELSRIVLGFESQVKMKSNLSSLHEEKERLMLTDALFCLITL